MGLTNLTLEHNDFDRIKLSSSTHCFVDHARILGLRTQTHNDLSGGTLLRSASSDAFNVGAWGKSDL